MEKSEKALFFDLQKSNHKAFDYFFEKYYAALFAYAKGMVSDSFVAEEIVQQMFVYLWENKEGINIHTSVKSYLFRAVHNDCMDYLKLVKQKSNITDIVLSTYNEPNIAFYDPLIEAEFQNIMNNVFSELPQQCRKIFILSRFEGLSYKDIALKLEISIKTVENQIGKALKIIREKLQPYLSFIFSFLF